MTEKDKDDDVDQVGDSEPDMMPPDFYKSSQKKKKGGKVHGEAPKKRLDKKSRGGASKK